MEVRQEEQECGGLASRRGEHISGRGIPKAACPGATPMHWDDGTVNYRGKSRIEQGQPGCFLSVKGRASLEGKLERLMG